MAAWLKYWLETYGKIKMRPSTYSSYTGNLRIHIKPHIGDIPLSRLKSADIQKFYVKLLSEGRVQRIESEHKPKGLRPKTVKIIYAFLSTTMDKAVAEKLFSDNSAKHCVLPKQEHE